MNRVITAHTPLPADQLMFRGMSGREGLSQLFEFQVELISPSFALDLRALLGKPLTLQIDAGTTPRFLNGLITRCVLVGRESATSRHYIYLATVQPGMWYLTQTSDSKIFQGKSVPDVVKEVLADYDFPVETKLVGNYRNWEYCVQYQETDFAFVSRLLEHEGIYYWFKHENGEHTLVLTDDVTQHEVHPGAETVPYYGPDRAAVPQEEFVGRWEISEQITPAGFATVDYDFKKPAASLDATRQRPGSYGNDKLEVYEWLGGYTDADHAEHYTRVRLEDIQSRQEMVYGGGNVRALAAGYLVTLRNHPRETENREYLIVSVQYRIHEGGYASGSGGTMSYDVDFSFLPSSTPFRPPRITPRPQTHGPQTARVVGKAGQEIWTDSYGRIKVQFHWDRYGQKNENSSCWVRVSSPWAGGGFGGIQLPRVNDEVIVDFIGGHPDRPIVIGRVYNAGNMPPWELPGNATQSGFLSRSQDGTPGTANAFMFEDKPGSEEIWTHAERNMRTEVEADELHSVDGNRSHIVGGIETHSVTGTRTTVITGHDSETFASGSSRKVTGDVNEDIEGNEARTFVGDVSESITGNVTETIEGNVTKTTTGDVTRTITGPIVDTITGTVSRTSTGDITKVTEGNIDRTLTGNTTDTMTGNRDLTLTGSTEETITGNITQTITGAVTTTTTGPIHITSDVDIVLQGKHVKDLSVSSWFKWTPAAVNLVGAQTTTGVINNTNWGIQAATNMSKFDATGYKFDMYGYANKIFVAEDRLAQRKTDMIALDIVLAYLLLRM